MRILFVLAAAYFSAIVWAGGYSGCLERVMFFQAYEIDGLLPTGQTIGYWCLKWDSPRKTCRNNQWKACAGSLAGNRCTFDELMSQISPSAPNPRQWPVHNAKGELDSKATALNCLKEHRAAKEFIRDVVPFKLMKGGGVDYRVAVKDLGNRIDKRWKALDATAKEANKPAFTAFDNSIDEIIRARRGDTGTRMYEAAKATLEHNDNVTLIFEELGPNPDPNETDPTKKDWKEIQWPATRQGAIDDGIVDGKTKVDDWLYNYNKNDRFVSTHRSMMKSFKDIATGRNLCR